MLIRIMTEPRNAIYRQFAAMLRADNVALHIEPTVFRQIAELAIEYKAGARSLRGIFEEMMTDVLYAIPDTPSIRQVIIRSLFEPAAFVTDGLNAAAMEAMADPTVNTQKA